MSPVPGSSTGGRPGASVIPMASPLPLPVSPEPDRPAPVRLPSPPPPARKLPPKPGLPLTLGLCLVAAAVTALGLWSLSNPSTSRGPSGPAASTTTAVAATGDFAKTLRIGGTLETLNFASVRAPKLRGPRDAGRADLTLAMLVDAGTVVPAGETVAEFELKWLEDHIVDRQSVVTTATADLKKRDADILILKETERQGRVNARAEHDKAVMDSRKAEVLSEIEAELLKNTVLEAHATWTQLEEEGRLMETVHAADLRGQELNVREQVLHVERHERDYERLQVKTPIPGMIVLESTFNRSGQFSQFKPGDQVYPGAMIMRVVDVSQMVVNAVVNQVDAQAIRIGDEATVALDAYPGERFRGRVADIGAVASSGGGGSRYSRGGNSEFVKHIRVRVLIEDTDERILPDLTASADVLVSERISGVIVPREAVRSDMDSEADYVYIKDGEIYRRRQILVQDRNDTEALIANGLQAGDEVLLSAPVPDGARGG